MIIKSPDRGSFFIKPHGVFFVKDWYTLYMIYSEFLATLTDCPFCATSHRIITENEYAFLTYAIAPYRPDHLLVIPKQHIEHVLELSPEVTNDLDALQRAGLRILNKLGHENVTLLVREGMGAGKSIPHLHYHLVPDILLGDTEHNGKERSVLASDEIDSLVSRLMSAL